MSEFNKKVCQYGAALEAFLAKQDTHHPAALAKALVVVAGHIGTANGITPAQLEEWQAMGVRVAQLGLGPTTACQQSAQEGPTSEKLPNQAAQRLGIVILEKIFEALPDELLETISLDELVDGLAMAIAHAGRAVEVPVRAMVSRMAVAAIAANIQLTNAVEPAVTLN